MAPIKLLVTGGTGFFGRALIKNWLKNKDDNLEITIISRSPELFLEKFKLNLNASNIKFYKGDILNFESLPYSKSFTHVLHGATESTTGFNLGTLDRFDHIVQGTRNVLELAVKTGAKRILLTSSGGVYGNTNAQQDGIEEDSLTIPNVFDPESAYAMGKRVSEHLCAQYNATYGIDFVVARCFAFVGEDLPMDAHFAIGNFIKSCINGEKIIIKGSGLDYRSYLYQEDLAIWLNKILMHGCSRQAYNVGSDKKISIIDLAKLVSKIINPNTTIEVIGEQDQNTKSNYFPNITRASQELNLRVFHNLEDSIRKTCENLR